MIAEVPFNEFAAFIAGKEVIRWTVKKGFYEVEYHKPRPVQNDLFATPAVAAARDPELDSPPRFTYETDPIACERRALAWARRK